VDIAVSSHSNLRHRGVTLNSSNFIGDRKKALCCSPNPTALETLTCDADLCSDFDEGCDEEDSFVGEGDRYYTLLNKRSYELSNSKRI
jgi:hypothetical protein